jgi:hypothetical protein
MQQYKIIERLVKAWNSDFTKVTSAELRELDEIEHDMMVNVDVIVDNHSCFHTYTQERSQFLHPSTLQLHEKL